jgi:phosphate transport system protein
MEHSLQKFETELREIRGSLARMAGLVAGQIEDALRALAAHDVSAARTTIERDGDVNRMDIEIEDLCLRVLALHQPVANDLRLIAAGLKIATELERIGDRAVNICEAAIHPAGAQDSIESHTAISGMGALAIEMVRDSIASFLQSDIALAQQVTEKDKEFDALYSAALPRLIAFTDQSPEGRAHEAKLAFLSKDLNEISEHATNIAELVIFMVEGKEIAHMDMHERRGSK